MVKTRQYDDENATLYSTIIIILSYSRLLSIALSRFSLSYFYVFQHRNFTFFTIVLSRFSLSYFHVFLPSYFHVFHHRNFTFFIIVLSRFSPSYFHVFLPSYFHVFHHRTFTFFTIVLSIFPDTIIVLSSIAFRIYTFKDGGPNGIP